MLGVHLYTENSIGTRNGSKVEEGYRALKLGDGMGGRIRCRTEGSALEARTDA